MARRYPEVGTFGSHLQHFARSVDIVDDQTVNEARSLVYEYIQDELRAAYFELTRVYTIDDAPALRTWWSSANKEFSTTIRKVSGQYSSQLAVCCDTGKPLWIVSPQREPLRRTEAYVDLWSDVIDLPRYRAPLERDLLTSIAIPMWRPNNRILGLMYLESTEYLDIAEFDHQELALLADALGVLLDLRDLNQVQTQGTRDAINNLRRIKDAVVFPQIARPQLFVAFSGNADQEVVDILGDVLNEFSSRLRIVQWNRIDDSGTITAQLADVITTSRFGLCYLSEYDHNTGGYKDNANVLFEAGMLQALAVLSIREEAAWIPLREEKSPPPPFDLAGERIEPIPRAADGGLNDELLRTRLRTRLQRLLGE
jgi:hypothetical protein